MDRFRSKKMSNQKQERDTKNAWPNWNQSNEYLGRLWSYCGIHQGNVFRKRKIARPPISAASSPSDNGQGDVLLLLEAVLHIMTWSSLVMVSRNALTPAVLSIFGSWVCTGRYGSGQNYAPYQYHSDKPLSKNKRVRRIRSFSILTSFRDNTKTSASQRDIRCGAAYVSRSFYLRRWQSSSYQPLGRARPTGGCRRNCSIPAEKSKFKRSATINKRSEFFRKPLDKRQNKCYGIV